MESTKDKNVEENKEGGEESDNNNDQQFYDVEDENPKDMVEIDKEKEAEIQKAAEEAQRMAEEAAKVKPEGLGKTGDERVAMSLIGANTDVEFATKKLQLIRSGEAAKLCVCEGNDDAREKSKGLIYSKGPFEEFGIRVMDFKI